LKPNDGCATSTTSSRKTISPPQLAPSKLYIRKLKSCENSPNRYWQRPDRHIRVLLHGHYRIAYLGKTSGAIDILGVFHGALNIERYLL
ncbi:MAG: hypothetical protein H0X01_06495, partial [Nitrospira sp.]|nr:hypothetical protein [Nitrospira sp.]